MRRVLTGFLYKWKIAGLRYSRRFARISSAVAPVYGGGDQSNGGNSRGPATAAAATSFFFSARGEKHRCDWCHRRTEFLEEAKIVLAFTKLAIAFAGGGGSDNVWWSTRPELQIRRWEDDWKKKIEWDWLRFLKQNEERGRMEKGIYMLGQRRVMTWSQVIWQGRNNGHSAWNFAKLPVEII